MHLTPAEQLILHSFILSPEFKYSVNLKELSAQISESDWGNLVETSITLGIGPLVYKRLTDAALNERVPVDAYNRLQQSYYMTLRRSMLLYSVFQQAARALTVAGIQVVALKGIYLSEHLYHDIGLRQVSDIDLLVKAEEGEKSIQVLSELGFRCAENPFSSHITPDPDFIHYPPMLKDGFSVEIHVRLHRDSPDYSLDVSEFIAQAIPVIIAGVEVHTLSFVHQLIFLCVHSEKHFTGTSIQFTCFADIANILTRDRDKIDWGMLIGVCVNNKCDLVVMKHVMLVHHFFNAPIPLHIEKQYAQLLKNEDKETFIRFLRGYMFAGNHVDHINKNIIKIKGFRNKIEYIKGNLFPPKGYMIARYRIKNESFYFLWYFFRFRIAVGSLLSKVFIHSKWVRRY